MSSGIRDVRDSGNEEGTIAVNQGRYTLDKQVNAREERPFSCFNSSEGQL